MRNMHIFDAIQHTDPKTFSRSCEIDASTTKVHHRSRCATRACVPRARLPPGRQYKTLCGRTASPAPSTSPLLASTASPSRACSARQAARRQNDGAAHDA
mmetsp:Transcript_18927/g.53552  ORF Transcript_18927/g.53552 Transcript_18927/m.53552 type:complete len:100 (+) Transcript_18927:1159-1458(+)